MIIRRAPFALASLLIVAALLPGCAIHDGHEPSFSGTFHGTTADGRAVVVAVTQSDERLWGSGQVGDEPLVMSGVVQHCAVGRLIGRDGVPVDVSLDLAPTGDVVRLEQAARSSGADAIVLARGDPYAAPAGGPFAGRFESRRRGVVAVAMVLEQRGELVSGWADIMGTSAGVAGRVDGRNHLVGSALLADGSEMPIDAVLDDDGRTLAILSQGLQCRMGRQ